MSAFTDKFARACEANLHICEHMYVYGHKKHKYTDEEIKHLKKCADPKKGPLYFAENFLSIQHPTKGAIKFKPYPYQKKLLKNYNENRFSISMLPRQTGKTTCASGYLIWYAMFKPDSQISIAAHK